MASQSEELKVVISVVDRLTAELGKLTGTIDKLEKHADAMNKEIEKGAKESTQSIIALNAAWELTQKTASLVATAVMLPINAFKGLTNVVTDLVREYDAEAVASVRLESTLRAQGREVEETTKRLTEYAQQLQETTRFSDDSILAAEALLATFVEDEKTLKAATKAAADFAAAFGQPIETAVQQVLTAMETGRLRIGKFSVELSSATNPITRAAEALKGLEERFGGTAEATAKVGAGPLEQLANTFSDLKENLGKLVAESPEFQAFIKTTKELIESLSKFTQENSSDLIAGFGKAFALSLEIAAKSAQALIFAADKLVFAANAVAEVFTTTPAEKLTEEIEDLQESTEDHEQQLAHYKGILDGTNKGLGAFFVSAEVAQKNVDLLTTSIDKDKAKLAEMQAELDKINASPIDDLNASFDELFGKLKAITDTFLPNFKKNLEEAKAATPEAQDSAIGEAIRRGAQKVESAGLVGDLAGEDVAEPLNEAAEELKESAAVGQRATDDFAAQVDAARAAAETTAGDFFLVTAGIESQLLEWAKHLVTEGGNLQTWGTTVLPAQHIAALDLSGSGTILSTSGVDLSTAAVALTGAADSIGGGLADFGEQGEKLSDAATALDNSAAKLTEAANLIISNLGGGEGVPEFAAGAIVRRPTRALIGEAGPEAVIPLNDEGAAFARSAFGFGGGGFSFNVNANSLSLDSRGMAAVAATMDRRFRDQLMRQRRVRSGSL